MLHSGITHFIFPNGATVGLWDGKYPISFALEFKWFCYEQSRKTRSNYPGRNELMKKK